MYTQRGVALLIIAIVMALSAITYFLINISPTEIRIDRQQQTLETLERAKRALIAHAITHSDQLNDDGEYGYLPCPDVNIANNNEGQSDSACNTARSISIGYFPWNTLGIDVLRDSAGNCLFYAVSPGYKIAPASMLNEDTNGLIQIVDSSGIAIKGAVANERPVAVVFAAEAGLTGQNKSIDSTTICGGDYTGPAVNLAAYLDDDGTTDNANPNLANDAIVQFVNATAGSANMANPLNDQLFIISREDIWKSILSRNDFDTEMDNLTQALAMCLVEYSKNNSVRRLPWPAPIDFAGADYRTDANYIGGSNLYAGRFPYWVDASNAVIPIAGDILLDRAECQSLTLDNGTVVTFGANDEYRKLWKNWKDHFFYAVSKVYEPVASPAPESECNPVVNDCITVEAFPYAGALQARAAVVFFSSSRRPGQSRDAPPPVGDSDDKALISNYLENGNDTIFLAATGTDADTYKSTDPDNSNDMMWCITNMPAGSSLGVEKCY